ncbi:MAG TPA: hypothetical protein VNZ45_08030, partial [Bacteroidia bacterium]|nr:hypothetical protein [Bacteroidia bacterium]
SISVSVAGGVSPYTYQWSNQANNPSISNLTSGTYSLTVTDASEGRASGSYVVANCIEWADITGAAVQGNLLIDNTSNGWGNSGANSYNILYANQNGWIQMPVTSLTTKTSFGLTAIYTAPNYLTFSFSFLIKNKSLYVYERGITKAFLGHVKINDVLMIQRIGSTINYLKNGVVIYQSNPPSTNPILAADFTADLVGSVSLFTNGAIISNVTCSFSNNLKVDAAITPFIADSAEGAINLTVGDGPKPYRILWNGIIYPSRAAFKRFIDSAANTNGLRVDTNIYHATDSLRAVQVENNLKSGIYPASVIDSLNDTVSINADVSPPQSWYNTSGVAIGSSNIPRYVSRIPGDSVMDTVLGGVPNLSQPVVTFSSVANNNTITKTTASGWGSGMATSTNVFRADQFSEVSFAVPNSTTLLAAGIRPDSLPNQNGYSDILFGYYFNKGNLSLIINGVLSAMGTYSAGNRFSIQNRYDSAKHFERIIYRQNGHLLKIAYVLIKNGAPDPPNITVMNFAPVYSFKVALNTNTSVITNVNFVNYYYIPFPIVSITPASCGFPNAAILSVAVVAPHGSFPASVYWTSGVNTYYSSVVNNAPIGVYYLHLKVG